MLALFLSTELFYSLQSLFTKLRDQELLDAPFLFDRGLKLLLLLVYEMLLLLLVQPLLLQVLRTIVDDFEIIVLDFN